MDSCKAGLHFQKSADGNSGGGVRGQSKEHSLEVAVPLDVGNILSFTGGAVVGVALLFAVRKLYR